MNHDEEPFIPDVHLEELEILELKQTRSLRGYPAKIHITLPPALWTMLSHLPKLRKASVQGFCLGKFGDHLASDSNAFPALKTLIFDGVATPQRFIKKLQTSLKMRHTDSDRRVHSIEFRHSCEADDYDDGVSTQNLQSILGPYVHSLVVHSEGSTMWKWPPPEETLQDQFQRRLCELGYSPSSPPSEGEWSW
ncbi:hypothetical protein NMY22_g6744 [Coprinellus aureogranulatus]|nr:hypothetical protein NMY22_g6744 [Coprinellus aureogranulatus]